MHNAPFVMRGFEMARPKNIQRPPTYYTCGEILGHLQAECERTGHEMTSPQEAVLYGLKHCPTESAIALLHRWWCYDLEKLLTTFCPWNPPKPRIDIDIEISRRGTFSVWWRPHSTSYNLDGSDFRELPYLEVHKENRLLDLRNFSPLTVFHRPPRDDQTEQHRPSWITPERISVDAMLLHATAQLIKELKSRLSHCFAVTMIADVFVEWQPDSDRKWESMSTLKTWEIKNVAEHEKQEALKLLDAFEKSYGCSLERFVEVAFAPDVKHRTGPAPLAHTKDDRSARQFKALGYPKLTPRVVRLYVGLLKNYRPELLPERERPPSNVVPFTSNSKT